MKVAICDYISKEAEPDDEGKVGFEERLVFIAKS
jgi:hypothetical protein